jgi:periplasmic protein TonB
MLARYSSSLTFGAIVTAILIYAMQLMIQTNTTASVLPRQVWLPVPTHIIEPPPPRVPRDPPQPPEPQPTPPDTPSLVTTTPNRTVLNTGLIAPGLTPPGPGTSLGDARPGVWIGSGELIALTQVQPVYPHSAEVRGLEGRVLVEFTVRADGSVRDPRIVESSDRIFERSALAAAARFRYQPRVVDGVAVAVTGVRTEFFFQFED